MADEKVTALDSEFLKRFIKENIVEFRAALDRMTKDSQDGPSMGTLATDDKGQLIDSPFPLRIGQMNNDAAGVNGGELNKLVKGAAEKIQELLEEHVLLFEEIEDALEETITELNKTQGGNLAGIPADIFMEAFEDVDDNFTGGGGGSDAKDG